MVGTERDEGEVPGALDGGGHRSLVLGAHAGLSARLYLPPVGHVPAKAVGILVVNVFDAVNAEAADLSATVIARPSASERPSSRSSAAPVSATASGPAAPARAIAAAGASSAWTVSAALLSAGPSTAARAIASASGPAAPARAIAALLRAAAGPRPLRLLRSCLLCRHINSPSATWYGV